MSSIKNNNNPSYRTQSQAWSNVKKVQSVTNLDKASSQSFGKMIDKTAGATQTNAQIEMSQAERLEAHEHKQAERQISPEQLEQLFKSVDVIINLVQNLVQELKNDSPMSVKDLMKSNYEKITQEAESMVYRSVFQAQMVAYRSILNAQRTVFDSIFQSQKLAFQSMNSGYRSSRY